MSEITFRAPADDDWTAILALAELSLSEFPNAPSQHEWLNNRRSFSPSDGIQQHFVATAGELIVGYACIEHRIKVTKGLKPIDPIYSLFVDVDGTGYFIYRGCARPISCLGFAPHRTDGQGIRHWFSFLE